MSSGLSNQLRFQRNKQPSVGSLYKPPLKLNSKLIRMHEECVTSRLPAQRHTSVEPPNRNQPTSALQRYFHHKRNKENIEDSRSLNISDNTAKSTKRPILRQILPSTRCEVTESVQNSFYNKLSELESRLNIMEELKKEVKIPEDFFSPVKNRVN